MAATLALFILGLLLVAVYASKMAERHRRRSTAFSLRVYETFTFRVGDRRSMPLIELVLSSYAPWLLVFSLHVWIFQSIENDRENAHRRLQKDVNNYLKSIEGARELEESARKSLGDAIKMIHTRTRKCYDTFYAQLTILAVGIFTVVTVGEQLPSWVGGLLISVVFVVMTYLLHIAVEARFVVRSTSLGF